MYEFNSQKIKYLLVSRNNNDAHDGCSDLWNQPGSVNNSYGIHIIIYSNFLTNFLINQAVPPVSYTKALDIFTGTCLVFIVMAIIEVSIVG